MDYHAAVLELLKASGFVHEHRNRHDVWRRDDGKTWTTPLTPSDVRAWQNNHSDLRRLVDTGSVKVLPPRVNGTAAHLDDVLRPRRPVKPKPIRERALGVLPHRVKEPPAIQQRPPATSPKERPLADIYSVGVFFNAFFMDFIREGVEPGIRRCLKEKIEEESETVWTKEASKVFADKQDPAWLEYVASVRKDLEPSVQFNLEPFRRAANIAVKIFQRVIRLSR